jgi:hypothetical protein
MWGLKNVSGHALRKVKAVLWALVCFGCLILGTYWVVSARPVVVA